MRIYIQHRGVGYCFNCNVCATSLLLSNEIFIDIVFKRSGLITNVYCFVYVTFIPRYTAPMLIVVIRMRVGGGVYFMLDICKLSCEL